MYMLTTILVDDAGIHKKWSYKTGDPAIAMRRFYAERGDRTWIVPKKIYTRKVR